MQDTTEVRIVSEQLVLVLPRKIADEAQIQPGDQVMVKASRILPGWLLVERPPHSGK